MRQALNLLLILTLVLSFNTRAEIQNGNIYIVDDLFQNIGGVKNNLKQDATKANYSCGPTSLLMINSHFSKYTTGGYPGFSNSSSDAVDGLKRLYASISQSYNTATSLTDLRSIAKYRWEWNNVRRMSASWGIDYNMDKLIGYLGNDIPAVIVLDKDFSGNPLYGKSNIDHIVIVYAYQKLRDENGNSVHSAYNDRQSDKIYFYDPYYGGTGHFTRGEVSQATNLAGFAYLTVAP